MSPEAWKRALTAAYDDFCARIDDGEDTAIDPYAAESPAEFFAVLSEVFFAEPLLLRREYPQVYEQCAAFYRQDPAARASALPPGIAEARGLLTVADGMLERDGSRARNRRHRDFPHCTFRRAAYPMPRPEGPDTTAEGFAGIGISTA